MRPAVVVALCVVVAAVTLGTVFLFSGDDDGKDDDPAAVTAPIDQPGGADGGTTDGSAEALLPQQLSLADVPFTFEFPGEFAAADTLPTGYLAILGIDPINFIDVRRTAEEELTDEQITGDIGGALETDTTDVIGTSTRTVGGITVFSFDVRDTSGAEPTTSRLSFFRTGGQTWELGCQWNDAGESTIDDACDHMLDTLAVTG